MFTWIPIYAELANKIMTYGDRQSDLINVLKEMKTTGLLAISLVDRHQQGNEVPLTMIDPFTFFACFNRGLTNENRRGILAYLKAKFDLQSELPTDFDGIPTVNNLSAWFFGWLDNRKPDDIPNLWELAKGVVAGGPEKLDPTLFERCLQIDAVGPAKLTMGMFWLNPKQYIAWDKNNRRLFKQKGIEGAVENLTTYLQLLNDVNAHFGTDYPQISRTARAGNGDGQDGDKQPLKDSLKAVLGLQGNWSAANTQPMQVRGGLVRNRIPGLLSELSERYGFEVEGRDGTGKKTRVPWVRLYDSGLSPSATDGWYVVYLFATDGSAVFLSLNQGTTKFMNGSFVPLDPELLHARVKDARSKLNRADISVAGLLQAIDLRDPGDKGRGYEIGNAYAIRYGVDQIPEDATILADTSRLLELLKILYTSTSPTITEQATYILAWNPENWNWSNLPHLAAQFRSGDDIAAGEDDCRWRIANKSVRPGDRLFLIRLGVEPKGILGSGYAVSGPFQGPHYSGEAGKTADYVRLKWDALLDPEHDKILSLTKIQQDIPEIHWTTQSSGILIPPEAHSELEKMWESHLSGLLQTTYTLDDAIEDVFLERAFFAEIYELARRRKNIVLQGPPGVGKTFIANRLAYALIGAKDSTRLDWVQFHQSYSYEDFILGFRPNGAGFELKPGIFYRFCEKAKNDSRTHVFVIDEINRGNLSRIFGEVLSLIEEDKRGELSVALAYGDVHPDASRESKIATKLTIPPNLILLGLMNTADRSLAVVDYALRRRFAFIDLEPRFDDPKFDAVLAAKGVSSMMREKIRNRIKALNSQIASDRRNLGRGFEIGHSFFCPTDGIQDEGQWFRSIIKYEIKPLLMEYWFDDQEKATREVNRLLGENTD
jgi:5-methylcytosine-specific restriction enzyme MrcB-like protein/dynein-related subfamily AAA family protein